MNNIKIGANRGTRFSNIISAKVGDQLKAALMKGHQLNISSLKITKEGLQEYWIQWKHKLVQTECE